MVLCESAVAAISHVAVWPRLHRSAAPAQFQGALDKHKGMKMLAAKADLAAGNGDVAASA